MYALDTAIGNCVCPGQSTRQFYMFWTQHLVILYVLDTALGNSMYGIYHSVLIYVLDTVLGNSVCPGHSTRSFYMFWTQR